MDGKENKITKENTVWEPFIERKFRDYHLGNITREEYDLAEQYIKEKSTLDFRKWLEKKNN